MKTLAALLAPVALLAQVNVPYERIRDAAKEPGAWLTYSRDYTGRRYSPLDQINTTNVGKLKVGLPARIKVGALPTDVVTGRVS